MRRGGIGLLAAAMLLASGPPARAAQGWRADADELLVGTIHAMSEIYLYPREPAVYAQWAIEALREAAADPAAVATCESEAGRAGSRDPGWRRLLVRTWRCVKTLNPQLEDVALFDAVGRHMVPRLDPQTDLLVRVDSSPDGNRHTYRPFSAEPSSDSTAGSIGLTITKNAAGATVIVATLPGSAAAQADIAPGDELVSINGRSIREIGLAEAINMLRGAIGSTARIGVRRPGSDRPAELLLERRTNLSPPSRFALHGTVVVVTVPHLGNYDDAATRSQLESLDLRRRPDLTAILIDLRGNPGGPLESARALADIFLDSGEIMSVRGQRQVQRLTATSGDAAYGKPLFILVDNGTAVGAEAVAAALADNRRATILGAPTRGAGTVRTVVFLGGDRALQISSGRIIRPNGQPLDPGVTPDVAIDSSPGENRVRDPALARALQVIGERVPAVAGGRPGQVDGSGRPPP